MGERRLETEERKQETGQEANLRMARGSRKRNIIFEKLKLVHDT